VANPAAINADGSLKALWVTALANPAAPTVLELTAASVVDLSCYLTADGFSPSTDEGAVTDDRICSRQTYEGRGRFTDGLSLGYVYRPQEPSAATNKAFTTLKAGVTGFVVARWGKDFETAIAAADVVDVWPAECGVQMKQPPEANSKLRVNQRMFIRDAVARDVAVV